ncbi:MAG: DNA-directed RNA polymerase subunit omega [Flavobacteriales bacterium]|jgi:BioD-like phosphotransacetylase family protein|nr:DNA-directed RNA polymerase subunit omega [Flavobacteriales bacterium]
MSNFKNTNAAKTTVTRNTSELYGKVDGNLFETIVLLNKRANQISREMKEELNQKLEEFGSHSDNLEEVFENREQIEISRHYERLPKPHSIAVQELIDGAIHYRYPEEPAN